MAKKRSNVIFSFLRLLAYWLFLTGLILTGGGLGGGLAGAWSSLPLFLLALTGVFHGALLPWAVGTLLVASLTTVVLMLGWGVYEFREKANVKIITQSPRASLQASPKQVPDKLNLSFDGTTAAASPPNTCETQNDGLPEAKDKFIPVTSSTQQTPHPLSVTITSPDPTPATVTTPPPQFNISMNTPSPMSSNDSNAPIDSSSTQKPASLGCDKQAAEGTHKGEELTENEEKCTKNTEFLLKKNVTSKDNHLRNLQNSPSKLPPQPLSQQNMNTPTTTPTVSPKKPTSENAGSFKKVFSPDSGNGKENNGAKTPLVSNTQSNYSPKKERSNERSNEGTPPPNFDLSLDSPEKGNGATPPPCFDLPILS